MSSFIELKKSLSALIEKSARVAKDLKFEVSADRLSQIKENLENKKVMIVTVGEARRGKSSLLNALADEKDPIFPVDINVCTNVVTVLKYGETEKVEVYIDDPSSKDGIKVKQITRCEIVQYVSEAGNANNYKNVRLLYVYLPNPILKDGVVLVDTPGVGSLNISHAEATYNYLPNADVVLFVSDVGSGYTETELEFLKKSYSFCKNIIFPVTKKDLFSDYEQIVEDNRVKIKKTIDIAPEDIKIIPVSSVAKLSYLETGKKMKYIHSNFSELEKCIWDTVAEKKVEILLLPFLDELNAEIAKIHNSIANEHNLLGENKEVVKALIEEYECKAKEIQEYSAKGAKWKNELNYYFQKVSLNTSEEINQIASRAQNRLNEYATTLGGKLCKEDQYTNVLMEINDIFAIGTLQINEKNNKSLVEELDRIKCDINVNMAMNEDVTKGVEFEKKEKIDLIFPKKTGLEKTVEAGKGLSFDMGGGGIVGRFVGMGIGWIMGMLTGTPGLDKMGEQAGVWVGTLLGAAKNFICRWNGNPADANIVKGALAKYIGDSKTDITIRFSNNNLYLRKTVTDLFDAEIKNCVMEITDEKERLKKNIEISNAELPKLQETLKKNASIVKALSKAADDLGGEMTKYKAVKHENVTVKANDLRTKESNKSEVKYDFL